MGKDRVKYLLLATFDYGQLRYTNLQNPKPVEDRLDEKIEKAK